MAKINSYKELQIWQLGIELADSVYKITDEFPKPEIYSLSNQMRRAAVSIPSNIAEGFGRFSKLEFIRYLKISLGSLNELRTQLLIAFRRNYLSRDSYDSLEQQAEQISKMLFRFLQTKT